MTSDRFAAWAAPGSAVALVFVLLLAPFVSPHAPQVRFSGLLNAPPTRVHVRDDSGRWRMPFIHPWQRVSQLEQRYAEGIDVVPLVWFHDGRLVQSADDRRVPLLLLGTDSVGRDVASRLLFGGRISLGVALAATSLALLMGAIAGLFAGYLGGGVDSMVRWSADFLLSLPAMYAALVLRSLLPTVLGVAQVFGLLTVIFAVMGAPIVLRGVRGIVRSERTRGYVEASRAMGATPSRILVRHLLPPTASFLIVQSTLLVPAFVVGEATFSYVGLGFPDPAPTWGTMLQEATTARAAIELPWLLSPALSMFFVVLILHAVGRRLSSAQSSQAPGLI